MTDTLIPMDDERAEALQAAVSAGEAPSLQEAVARAVDAWLTERALGKVTDEALQRLWQEGIESGDAGAIDFNALKAEARHNNRTP